MQAEHTRLKRVVISALMITLLTASTLLPTGLLLSPSSAMAQSATDRLAEAKALFTKADFPASLKALERAKVLATSSETLARIEIYRGANHLVLGDHAKARAAFDAAIGHDPGVVPPTDRFSAETVALYNEAKARIAPGTLVVSAPSHDGAEVFVDKKRLGTVPLTRKLEVGPYTLRVVSVDGQLSHEERVVIRAEQTKTVTAELKDAGAPDAPGAPPVVPPGDEEKVTSESGGRLWTWIALGTALVSAGVGFTFWGLGQLDEDEHDSAYPPPLPSAPPPPPKSLEEIAYLQDLASRGRRKATIGNVLVVAGGVLAAASVVLFFVEGPDEKKAGAEASNHRLLVGPGSVGYQLRF